MEMSAAARGAANVIRTPRGARAASRFKVKGQAKEKISVFPKSSGKERLDTGGENSRYAKAGRGHRPAVWQGAGVGCRQATIPGVRGRKNGRPKTDRPVKENPMKHTDGRRRPSAGDDAGPTPPNPFEASFSVCLKLSEL